MALWRIGRLTAVAASIFPAALLAQRPGSSGNKVPDKDAAQVMIASFKSAEAPVPPSTAPEKTLSYQAAEEMRKKVDGAFPSKQLFVIPVERLNANLEASKFPVAEGLEIHDARALASISRADEFIQGTVAKTATGFKVDADLVLTRDINARQPLGASEAPKLADAITGLVNEYKKARLQLDAERKCVNAARDQKWAEATQFANAAITAYPKSTLGRACLLNVLALSKAPDAEIVKVAKDLVAIDSRSNTALNYIMESYDKAGPSMSDSLVLTLLKMMQNDPRNSELANAAITRIAAAKNPGVARPIIDSAVVQNPGDPDLLKLRWQILYAMKDFPTMLTQGKELVRYDTSFADSLYYVRTADAYRTDSNFKAAAATLAEGSTKFPQNAFLVGLGIQMLQRAGDTQQALDKIRKANNEKVPIPDGGTIEIQIMSAMGAPSGEIVSRARTLIAAGDTSTNIRQSLLNEQQKQMAAGTELVKTDGAAAVDSLNALLGGLKESESIARPGKQKAHVAFLTGMTNTTIASVKAQQAAAQKSCQLAKDARVNATAAMTSLPQGAEFAPAATVQTALGNAIQIDGYAENLMKSFPNCK